MKKLFFLILILPCYVTGQLGSDSNSLKIDYSPVSPESSMLFKFSDIPIGYYTGTPNVNIPLYEIQDGNLNVPISLSYHSGGNKVKEVAPWTGLGWKLNGYGTVTREVRGLPDDTFEGTGFLKLIENYTYNDVVSLEKEKRLSLYEQISLGCTDSEPDMFYFNVNGLSGKFMFNWDGTINIESNRNIKIDYELSTYNNANISTFIITDDYGTIYTFNSQETTTKEPSIRNGFCGLLNKSYVSGWHLRSIVNANATHRIDYEYAGYTINHNLEITDTFSRSLSINCPGGDNRSRQSISYSTRGRRLKKITSDNIIIEFNIDPDNERTDIGGENLYPLDNIKVTDKNNNKIKEYTLIHNNNTGRLTLKQINQISNINTELRLYNFDYHTTFLPGTSSKATDHWGYFNNRVNNLVTYPKVNLNEEGCPEYLEGANKEPEEDASMAGILTKITYPTGGYSVFDYESHDYNFIQTEELPDIYSQKSGLSLTTATSQGREVVDQETFTIGGNKVVEVRIVIRGNTVTNFGGSFNAPKFKLVDANNQDVYSIPPIPYTEPGQSYYKERFICLSPGTYKGISSTRGAFVPERPSESNSIEARISWTEDTDTVVKRKAGGVRVKGIKEYDYDNTLVKQKRIEYTVNDQSSKSSGALTAFPNYLDKGQFLLDSGNGGPQNICTNLELFSGSLIALGSAYGHVEYKEVNVYEGIGDKETKVKYEYYSYENGPDFISKVKPYPPLTSNHFKRNLLKRETNYKIDNSTYAKVGSSDYEYYYSNSTVPSLKVNFAISGIVLSPIVLGLSRYAEAYYNNNLGYNEIKKKTDSIFDQNGVFINRIQRFYTYNKKRLKDTSIITSRNNELKKNIIYYADYYPDTQAYEQMVTKNMIAIPVREEFFLDTNLIDSKQTFYKDWRNTKIFPEFVQTAKGSDALENRIVYKDYDLFGNPLEVQKEDGTPISYIWGYNYSYPIAKIVNATYDQIAMVLGVTTAELKAFNESDLDTINTLRTALLTAQTTTFTHEVLVGVTSITDPSGYTMTYHYDKNNRLEFVKDADGNLVSQNKYNYRKPK